MSAVVVLPCRACIVASFFKLEIIAMNNERDDHDDVGLAEIWRNAHHRRTQDVRWWITKVFKKQRPFKLRLTEAGVRLSETLLASRKPGMTGGQSG